MNQSHVIDIWVAELGLSARRVRRGEGPALPAALTPRPARAPSPARGRADYTLRPRYQVISSPC